MRIKGLKDLKFTTKYKSLYIQQSFYLNILFYKILVGLLKINSTFALELRKSPFIHNNHLNKYWNVFK